MLVVDVYHRPQVSGRLGDEYRGEGQMGELKRKRGRGGKWGGEERGDEKGGQEM